MPRHVPATGQRTCHDTRGAERPCAGTGEDAERRAGVPWPAPRFAVRGETVEDRLTGLVWSRDADPVGLPLTWTEALEAVRELNGRRHAGCADWRLPNRRELRSLVSHQTRRPALPEGHPFENVFCGWYWSSTSFAGAPSHAWYVDMDGGRMFYGGKDQSFLLWPVRGAGNGLLARTGQTRCFGADGGVAPCAGSGQDGELRMGAPWPEPRFEARGEVVLDRLTGLEWMRRADLCGAPCTWQEALDAVRALNARAPSRCPWRLPNVNELESLSDCDAAWPALPPDAPFEAVCEEGYWSSTTSLYEPDWAWALYVGKGAIGVGQKAGAHFRVWPVRDARLEV